ncbi:unnamed protein product [Blepharisma stoltei]|uniref:Thioesterase domain-containing protein n=1 Tax=Blepharisma stoltei TaxID=1481888 RepID=A0AAU9KC02_9CILI|nr:unnamed protein product [Blepharisma stoltei]
MAGLLRLEKIFTKVRNRTKPSFDMDLYIRTLIEDVKETENSFNAKFKFYVTPEYCNHNGLLHGGAISTMLDNYTYLVVIAADKLDRTALSTNLTLSFISSAAAGDELTVTAEVLKIEDELAHAQAEIWNGGKLVAHGKHTLGFVSRKNYLLN